MIKILMMLRLSFYASLALINVTDLLAEPAFVYTMTPEQFVKEQDNLCVLLTVREKGEPYGSIQYIVPASSRWRKIFDESSARFATEEIFYEIALRKEIPRSKGLIMPRLDIVTKEVLDDLAKLGQRALSTESVRFDDSNCLSLKETSENQFLGIIPRIVKPE